MCNKYYDRNNYEEFYNEWTSCDDECRNHCDDRFRNFCDNECRNFCDDGHRDCCDDRRKDCCDNGRRNCCDDGCRDCCDDGCREQRSDNHRHERENSFPEFERRPIRRCDEEAIEREINRLFKFILNELCDVEQDVDAISRAFVRLANLLVEDTCLESGEEQLICCVAKDLKALQVLIDKTIRDTRCLKKEVKCN